MDDPPAARRDDEARPVFSKRSVGRSSLFALRSKVQAERARRYHAAMPQSTSTSTKTRVKIGLTFAPREVDIDVDDAERFIREFESAIAAGGVWWVTDREGHRHGLVVEKIAYVDVEPGERDRTIGFG